MTTDRPDSSGGDSGAGASGRDGGDKSEQRMDGDGPKPEDRASRDERGELDRPKNDPPNIGGGGGGGGGGLSALDIGTAMMATAEKDVETQKQKREQALKESNENWERRLRTRLD